MAMTTQRNQPCNFCNRKTQRSQSCHGIFLNFEEYTVHLHVLKGDNVHNQTVAVKEVVKNNPQNPVCFPLTPGYDFMETINQSIFFK